jgi:hypothetical protein
LSLLSYFTVLLLPPPLWLRLADQAAGCLPKAPGKATH